MEEKRTVTSILDSSFMKWVAFIFATIGVVWIFYDNFVKKNCATFEYEILSETSIFNNQEDISLLRIFIDSLDVQKSHANISFFTIKITNNGDKHISTESYDSGNFGLNLHNGFVIEPPVLISASTEYLQRKINPDLLKLRDSAFIEIPRTSLDIDDYYIIKFGMLHHNDSIPGFDSEGKIVGQKKINIKNITKIAPSLSHQAVSGRWNVQIIRFLFYGLLFFVLFICLLWIFVEAIPNYKANKKRATVLKDILGSTQIDFIVREDYIAHGAERILQIHNTLKYNDKELTKKYNKSLSYITSKNSVALNNKGQRKWHELRMSEFNNLIDKKYIIQQPDNTFIVDKRRKASVDYLYNLLQKNGLLQGFPGTDITTLVNCQ